MATITYAGITYDVPGELTASALKAQLREKFDIEEADWLTATHNGSDVFLLMRGNLPLAVNTK